MTKNDLTVSEIKRQNILNNSYAIEEIEKGIGIKGITFEGKTVVLEGFGNEIDFGSKTIQRVDLNKFQ